jgi:hypothetical protein
MVASWVRIPPGCKVFRNLYLAMLLFITLMHYHCVYLKKIKMSKKSLWKNNFHGCSFSRVLVIREIVNTAKLEINLWHRELFNDTNHAKSLVLCWNRNTFLHFYITRIRNGLTLEGKNKTSMLAWHVLFCFSWKRARLIAASMLTPMGSTRTESWNRFDEPVLAVIYGRILISYRRYAC